MYTKSQNVIIKYTKSLYQNDLKPTVWRCSERSAISNKIKSDTMEITHSPQVAQMSAFTFVSIGSFHTLLTHHMRTFSDFLYPNRRRWIWKKSFVHFVILFWPKHNSSTLNSDRPCEQITKKSRFPYVSLCFNVLFCQLAQKMNGLHFLLTVSVNCNFHHCILRNAVNALPTLVYPILCRNSNV